MGGLLGWLCQPRETICRYWQCLQHAPGHWVTGTNSSVWKEGGLESWSTYSLSSLARLIACMVSGSQCLLPRHM